MALVWRRLLHYNGMERKDKELMDLINNFFLSPSIFISAPLPPSLLLILHRWGFRRLILMDWIKTWSYRVVRPSGVQRRQSTFFFIFHHHKFPRNSGFCLSCGAAQRDSASRAFKCPAQINSAQPPVPSSPHRSRHRISNFMAFWFKYANLHFWWIKAIGVVKKWPTQVKPWMTVRYTAAEWWTGEETGGVSIDWLVSMDPFH